MLERLPQKQIGFYFMCLCELDMALPRFILKLEIVFFNPSRNFTQYELVDGKTKQNCDEFFWSQIPNSNSCIPTCTGPCHALWLFGLRAVGHCFFNDKEILSLLNTVLAGRRDVYSHLNYPSFPLPTYVQSPALWGNLRLLFVACFLLLSSFTSASLKRKREENGPIFSEEK